MVDSSFIATIGYMLYGGVSGYIFGRVFSDNVLEPLLVGFTSDFAIGLIKQYKISSKI